MGISMGKNAPADGRAVVARHLAAHGEEPEMAPMARAAAAGDSGSGGVSEGYQSYLVTLDDLAKGNLLDAAKPGAWTFMVHDREGVSAEIELGEEAGGSRVLSTRQGPTSAGTLGGLLSAEADEQLEGRDYEARLLRCPGIHLFALWFHAEDDDVIMPIDPDMTGLEHNQIIRPEDAAETLKTAAASILEQAGGERGG